MSRSRSSMEEAGGSTEPGAPSAVAAAAGAASNVVASAPTTKSRRAYHLVPDPAIYPPGAFHAPNIIDAPARRKRKDVEDYHMHVSKLRSAAAAAIALPRARQPPERLVITAKGPQLKRTRLDDVAPTPLVLVESSSSSSSVGEAKDDAESSPDGSDREDARPTSSHAHGASSSKASAGAHTSSSSSRGDTDQSKSKSSASAKGKAKSSSASTSASTSASASASASAAGKKSSAATTAAAASTGASSSSQPAKHQAQRKHPKSHQPASAATATATTSKAATSAAHSRATPIRIDDSSGSSSSASSDAESDGGGEGCRKSTFAGRSGVMTPRLEDPDDSAEVEAAADERRREQRRQLKRQQQQQRRRQRFSADYGGASIVDGYPRHRAKLPGSGATIPANVAAAKRLAIESSQAGGLGGGGGGLGGGGGPTASMRHTRLTAAAHLVVAADLGTAAGLLFNRAPPATMNGGGGGGGGAEGGGGDQSLTRASAGSTADARKRWETPDHHHRREGDSTRTSPAAAATTGADGSSPSPSPRASHLTRPSSSPPPPQLPPPMNGRATSASSSSASTSPSNHHPHQHHHSHPSPHAHPLLPACFTSAPLLSESGLSRLGLSGLHRATHLDFDWVSKRCQRYLNLLTEQQQAERAELDLTSTSKEYLQRQPHLGTLANGRVYVAVSAQSDHNLLWLDDHTKAEAHRQAQAAAALANVHGPERRRWMEMIDEDERATAALALGVGLAGGGTADGKPTGEKSSTKQQQQQQQQQQAGALQKDHPPHRPSSTPLPSSAGGASGGASPKRIPMLGLFAACAIPEGGWVTEYGGVLEWGGQGQTSAKTRAAECNTHVRRIGGSDFVWNGRPWSLLFPRVPSFLEREMRRPMADRRRIEPTITHRTLVNLLLLLHHEEQTHTPAFSHHPGDRQKSHQLPFTARDMADTALCQGTCLLCRNEMNILLQPLGGRAHVGPLTHDDVLATFLPQCACCSVTVGLLPCEIHSVFSKWCTGDQERLWALCARVQLQVHAQGGLGYMANTHHKARQNVRVASQSRYVGHVRDMHPRIHTYQATKPIAAGEEIFVAYNNNESRTWREEEPNAAAAHAGSSH